MTVVIKYETLRGNVYRMDTFRHKRVSSMIFKTNEELVRISLNKLIR